MAIIKKSNSCKYQKGCGKVIPSYIAGGNKNGMTAFKSFVSVIKMLNINLAYYPAITFLENCPREMKTCTHKYLYMNVHGSIIQINQAFKIMQIPIS